MTMTITVSNSCKSPIATWLPLKNDGSGQPHSMCPIEKYINASQKPRDARRRFFRAGVSLSFSASSPEESWAV